MKCISSFIIRNKIISFITNNNVLKEFPEDLKIKLKKLRKKELITMLLDEHIPFLFLVLSEIHVFEH